MSLGAKRWRTALLGHRDLRGHDALDLVGTVRTETHSTHPTTIISMHGCAESLCSCSVVALHVPPQMQLHSRALSGDPIFLVYA